MSSHGENTLDSDSHGILPPDDNKPFITKKMAMFIFFAIFSIYMLCCMKSAQVSNIPGKITGGSFFGAIDDLYL